MKIFFLLGPAGSGKGTQAKLLVKKFRLEYFGSGDALRARQRVGDFTSKKLKRVMGRGELVPSFIISKLWIDKLEIFKKKKEIKGFVIDGSPRKIAEANLLEDAIKWYEWEKIVKIILIDISQKESINRLTKRRMCKKCGCTIPWAGNFKNLEECDKCGGKIIKRPDDSLISIKKRLEEFKDEVIPVINHYKKQRRLIRINGEQSIENVFRDILRALK